MKSHPWVGILAFQGDFSRHQEAFAKLCCLTQLVKSPWQLEKVDCLVIPGGESSVINRFVQSTEMYQPIIDFAMTKPVWGTCAGMILLAAEVVNDPTLTPFKLLNVSVDRNAYGRQYESFIDVGEFTANGKSEKLEMVFIRAPKFVAVGDDVEILGHCRGEMTVVRQGKVLASAFHPELTKSTRFQEYFLSMI